ncbi:MAG: DUF6694 family lipoprotein, partial [Waterburya sp.]
MRSTITILIFVSLLFTSCSSRINTSSKSKMESSIEKVRQSLPENKREEFDMSLQWLLFIQRLEYMESIIGERSTTNNSELNIELEGKTGLEIIALAENLQKDFYKEEQEQVRQEIKELENKKVSAENDKRELAKFKVISYRFYKQQEEYYGEELIIELTMKNETTHPISQGYFIGTLATPNRAVPWLQKLFSYSIPGGLEPGEEINLRLLVQQYKSKLNIANIPQNAVFNVEVKQLDGANKQPLFSMCKFTPEDEQRLKELKESLGDESIIASELYA